jgi:hypothetical protein
VSEALGPANPQITAMIYAHAIPGVRLGVTETMARLLRDGNTLGTPTGTDGRV